MYLKAEYLILGDLQCLEARFRLGMKLGFDLPGAMHFSERGRGDMGEFLIFLA